MNKIAKAINFLLAIIINYLLQFVTLTMDHQIGCVEIDKLVEILNNELYFAVLKGTCCRKMKSTVDTFYFSIDDELIYHNYYCDFGPFNISCLYKYCCKLNKFLTYAKGIKKVVHYTTSNEKKKTNSAFLIGSFAVIYLKLYPDHVYKMIGTAGPFMNFVDASQCPSVYRIQIIDCLHALYKAMTFNFFNFSDFDDVEYDTRTSLQYGDLNWLVPRKFLALIGPTENGFLNGHPPEFYIKYFLKNDVKTVIRLNNKFYDASVFKSVGIDHFDLIFPDGTTPPRDILFRFLEIVENAPAVVAVHCKAGLGRTGSLIGAYLIKHYRLTAREAIAWMRICRPGSVIGQQQNWLEKHQNGLWKMGAEYRYRMFGNADKIPCHKYGIYSRKWPMEREKIINDTRQKIQTTFSKSQCKNLNQKPNENSTKLRPKSAKNGLKEIINIMSKAGCTDSQTNKKISTKSGTKSNQSSLYKSEVKLKSNLAKDYTIKHPLQMSSQYLQFSKPAPKKNKATQGDKLNDIKAARLTLTNIINMNSRKHPKDNISILYQKY